MKRFVVNHRTYLDGHGNPSAEDVTGQVSMTVPGMTLSLKELLARYVRGEHVNVLQPQFSDDPDIPDGLERMSEMDRLDLARDLKDGISREQKKRAARIKELAEIPISVSEVNAPAVEPPLVM